MTATWKRLVLVSVVALALQPVTICAQARSRYQWKTVSVGSIRNIGGDFSSYSSGIGGLKSAGMGMPTGILKSSLTSNYSLYSGGSSSPTGTLGSALPKFSSPKAQSYGSPKIGLTVPTKGAGVPKLAPDAPRLTTDTPHAGAASGTRSDLLSKAKPATDSNASKTEAISSLVPSEPGQYQKYMRLGDQAFRAERFIEASESFDLAIAMGRYLPESHLSLVHAHFATGRYYSASHHLRQALKIFPDLPIVPMRVRLFYGRSETFVGHVEKLRQEIEDSGPDAEMSFLLAYFRYFDDAETDAAKLLRQARSEAGKNDQGTIEAMETFWSGMVDAGKAEGTLGTATQAPETHSPTTAPSDKDEKKRAEEKAEATENK